MLKHTVIPTGLSYIRKPLLKNILLALVEELGQEYKFLLKGHTHQQDRLTTHISALSRIQLKPPQKRLGVHCSYNSR